MREVLFKNLWSAEAHKKDIILKEAFERDGLAAKTERRSFYFIKDVIHTHTEEELNKWVSMQDNKNGPAKRHFHIMKEHSDISGTDKFICKILGTFYAVVGKDIYTIAFLHSFKVSFAKGLLTQ